jgi:hypothetical protein
VVDWKILGNTAAAGYARVTAIPSLPYTSVVLRSALTMMPLASVTGAITWGEAAFSFDETITWCPQPPRSKHADMSFFQVTGAQAKFRMNAVTPMKKCRHEFG